MSIAFCLQKRKLEEASNSQVSPSSQVNDQMNLLVEEKKSLQERVTKSNEENLKLMDKIRVCVSCCGHAFKKKNHL